MLRFADQSLHSRLYVLEHGPFNSTDDQEALLKAALPADDVKRLRKLFRKEDASVQLDLDVLIEFEQYQRRRECLRCKPARSLI